jgi:hypothetical protein
MALSDCTNWKSPVIQHECTNIEETQRVVKVPKDLTVPLWTRLAQLKMLANVTVKARNETQPSRWRVMSEPRHDSHDILAATL